MLYGSFALLRKIAAGELAANSTKSRRPMLRCAGSTTGTTSTARLNAATAGARLFWEDGHVRDDMTRVSDYGRLLASVGINGCSINNVNADLRVISPDYLPQIAKIADALRPWGVRVAVSVDFGSPQCLGKLDTFDPLDSKVIAWWKSTVDQIYAAVPDLGGIVVKADSEGRVGPSAYHRTHADAANVVARALAAHGGLLFYRGFVYDHHMDWTNLKLDRARAADDNFRALDGAIRRQRHHPDQTRTDRFPGARTRLARCSPRWKEPTRPSNCRSPRSTSDRRSTWSTWSRTGKKRWISTCMRPRPPTPVKALAAGKIFHRPTGGFVGVSNVGLDENWAGNHHSMANLYGFGRLAWNPDLSAQRIIDEWTKTDLRQRSEGTRNRERDQPRFLARVTRTTPDRWACRPSPISSATTTA